MRIQLRRAVLILSCLAVVQAAGLADDRAAQARMHQWKEALSSSPRLAVHFRTKRINSVFQSVEEHSGVFYRNEHGKAVFRLGECADRPLSAVKDINAQLKRAYNHDEPGLVCAWDESYLGVDVEKYPKLVPYCPVSALYPDNAPTVAGWYFSRAFAGRLAQIHFSPSDMFPLLFVESPEIGWYDAKLLGNAKSPNVCLRLSLPPGTASNRTRSVDALFRPGESFPFAIRRFDPAGMIEFRFFIDSIQTGEEAVIPDDAFQRTTSN